MIVLFYITFTCRDACPIGRGRAEGLFGKASTRPTNPKVKHIYRAERVSDSTMATAFV